VVLGAQLFNHCEPLSYGARYPIFPGRIIVTFMLPRYDFLDGIHLFDYTRQPTSARPKTRTITSPVLGFKH
jgi:hypothetical protein